ncbi:alpha/beta hydrolase [Curvivirga aplysinae]|uniref:alpha/beta hydrolase n=1 Tax=Curvivirga aplysinae TaxID=2529852 RepID=UPI0012BD7ACF|nr:alpha/beta hydrolase [Curvivirga aplysinae]MTI08795.1 alpha/beta hydrolase [Curvivirga aplysinae]
MTIEKEMLDFVAETNRLYPEDTALRSPEEQKSIYENYVKAFTPPRPDGVTAKDFDLIVGKQSVPARLYTKEDSLSEHLILFFHGGGYVVGNPDSHDGFTAWLCNETQISLLSVDYPLAPAASYQEIEEAARLAWKWCLENANDHGFKAENIILCGDSAGGHMSACMSQYLADQNSETMPLGQILIYPSLGFDMTTDSYKTEAEAPLLTKSDIEQYSEIVYGGRKNAPDSARPAYAKNKENLPPTMLLPVEHDPLRDDAILYHDMLKDAGVESHLYIGAGLLHGSLRAYKTSPGVQKLYAAIVDRIAEWHSR